MPPPHWDPHFLLNRHLCFHDVRLSLGVLFKTFNTQKVSRTSHVFTFSYANIKCFLFSGWTLPVRCSLPSSLFTIFVKTIKSRSPVKSYCHRTDLKNKNSSLRLHGGFFLCFCVVKKYPKTHVINLNTREHFVTLPRHLPSWAVHCIRFSGEPEMSMDSSTLMKNKINLMT